MPNILKKASYSGTETYKYIDRLIRGSKTLYIVSPYIDSYYASFVKRNSGKKKVYILASSIDGDAYKELTKSGGRINKGLLYILLIAIAVSVMLYLTGTYIIDSLIATLLISSTFLLSVRRGTPSNISVKTPNEFVHAKMYVSDSMAIVGSANLTYKGTHKNVEYINILYSKEEVEKMKQEFFKLWNAF